LRPAFREGRGAINCMCQKRIKTNTKFILSIFVFIFIFFNAGSPAIATDSTSTNFISRDPIMSDFGGRATSTNFGQINAGGQTVTGISTSSNFILKSGFLYFGEFNPKSRHWRWYDDETSETPTQPLAAENVAPTDIELENLIKLRLSLREIGGDLAQNIKFKLQFSEFSDFSQGVFDVEEISNCSEFSVWCYGNGVDSDGALLSTLVLSGSAVNGTHNEFGSTTSTFNHPANAITEYEFTIKSQNPTANTIYFFRAFDTVHNKPVSLDANKQFPSLTTRGAALTFNIAGLPAGALTEGIVTDASSTATAVPFGDLALSAETEIAQRLTVTTNAALGYQIFAYQRQGLTGPTEISPVSSTNEVPDAWAIAPSATGAFGYHAGDDALSGGSSRFAPNNTYARLESIPKEIAANSHPVGNESNDIVFKVQITPEQEVGNYQAAIVYIIVPTF